MSSAAASIRRALPADAPVIARIIVDGWRAAYAGLMPAALLEALSVEERTPVWRERLADPGPARTFLIEVAGAALGFASIGPTRDADLDAAVVAEIHAIYLLPVAWGRGLGRALFTHTRDDLAASGARVMTLWVLDTNARARRFYEAAGMRADGATKIEREGGFDLPHVRYTLSLDPPAR